MEYLAMMFSGFAGGTASTVAQQADQSFDGEVGVSRVDELPIPKDPYGPY